MYTEISYAFSIWFNSTTIVWYIATNGFHGLFSYNSHVMSYSKAKQQYIRSEHFSKWIYEYQKFVYACLGVIFANTSTQFVLSLIYNHDNNNNIYYYITNESTVYACCVCLSFSNGYDVRRSSCHTGMLQSQKLLQKIISWSQCSPFCLNHCHRVFGVDALVFTNTSSNCINNTMPWVKLLDMHRHKYVCIYNNSIYHFCPLRLLK